MLIIIQLVFSIYWTGDAEPYGMGYYMVYVCPLVRMIEFVEGTLLYMLYQKIKDAYTIWDKSLVTLFETFVILIYVVLFTIGGECIPYNYKASFIWIIPSLALVWIFATMKGNITLKCGQSRLLLYLGKLSFELFIIHRVVIMFVAEYLQGPIALVIAFIVTVLLAETSKELEKYVTTKRKIDTSAKNT